MTRWEHEAVLERMTAAVTAHPEKLAARKTLIEHCWGTLKWLLPGGFLVRGKEKVGAEVSLAHFGYNLKRALAVVGLEKLLAALAKFVSAGGGPLGRWWRALCAAGRGLRHWAEWQRGESVWVQLRLIFVLL